MRLLITRPEEDARALAAVLAARGMEAVLAPVMTVIDVPGEVPDMIGVQALLITSTNGIRAFARRHGARTVPVCAVGDASAAAARELGFTVVRSAAGDVEALTAMVVASLDPGGGALLHVAGSHVAGDLQGALETAGFAVRRQVLYEARAADALAPETKEALGAGTVDGVVLFSPRTGRIFAGLVAEAGLEARCRGLVAYCLSAAVADAVRELPWRTVVVAPAPDQDSLVDAIGASGTS